MNSLLAYSGIVTKMRAMQKNLITEDGFREIVSCPDVPAVASYLRDIPGYEEMFETVGRENLHRGRLESLIRFAVLEDFAKLYHFANEDQRYVLRVYAMRYEVQVLKELLGAAYRNNPLSEGLLQYQEFFRRYTSLKLDVLAQAAADSFDSLLRALRPTAYGKILETVRGQPGAGLFLYESALDRFYFQQMWEVRKKVISKGSLSAITEYYGSKSDALNLLYISRARSNYSMSPPEIYSILIPVYYRLRRNEISALVEAESEERFHSLVMATSYGKELEDSTPEALQNFHTRICREILEKNMRKNPYSLVSVFYYLYQKEHEIYRLVTAIECVRYGMSPDEAMKYVTVR